MVAQNNSFQDSITVRVLEREPPLPEVIEVNADPDELWSSDNRMVPVTLAVAFCGALILGGCGLGGDPDRRVVFGEPPSDTEIQYLGLARFINSEKPCYLISRDSVIAGGMVSHGNQASFIRSDCFRDIAIENRRPELCEHIVTVNTLLYAGHKLNRRHCEESIERGCCAPGTGKVDREVVFELAGFKKEDIEALLRKHDIPPSGAYCLLFSREFFKAIENLPNFAGDEDLEGMKKVEWRPHQLLRLQGYPCTGKFL